MITVNGTDQPLILAARTSLGADSFRTRVEAAAAAGFDGIGLSIDGYREVLASGLSPADVRAVIADNGLSMPEIDAVFGYAIKPENTGIPFGGGLVYSTEKDLNFMFEMATVFGATCLLAVGAFDNKTLEPDAVERFAGLCDKAAEVGLSIALEFLPNTNVSDAGISLSIVEGADRPNGGLCIDTWHHTRSGESTDLLRSVPEERLIVIQVNDGPAVPADDDYIVETMHYRQSPGTGEFELGDFFDALLASGASVPISVEVLSDEIAAMDPFEGARKLADGTTAALASL